MQNRAKPLSNVEVNMEEVIRGMLRGIGMTNEDMAKITPGQERMLATRPIYSTYRMVVEVIEAKYCFAGLKPGDTYNFSV